MNGDSVYDIYYSDEDLSPDAIISALKDPANQEDLTDQEKYWMHENNPERFFWEYNTIKENLLGKTDELVQRKLGQKKKSVVDTAIDTSMALSHEYGKTNLVTGTSRRVMDSLHQEVNLSTDRLKSSGKLSRIKTGQKINKLRSRYIEDREQQREDYLIARWEGGIGYEKRDTTDTTIVCDPTVEDCAIDFSVVNPSTDFTKDDDYTLGDRMADAFAFDLVDGGPTWESLGEGFDSAFNVLNGEPTDPSNTVVENITPWNDDCPPWDWDCW